MCVQPYGNSDGSDKGDYHGKWEAAINSKKKKAKYMDPLSKLRCLSSCMSHPNSPWMSCFAIYQPLLCNSVLIYAFSSHRKCTQTQNLCDIHIQQCSSHSERPGLKVWTQLFVVRWPVVVGGGVGDHPPCVSRPPPPPPPFPTSLL